MFGTTELTDVYYMKVINNNTHLHSKINKNISLPTVYTENFDEKYYLIREIETHSIKLKKNVQFQMYVWVVARLLKS